MMTPTTTAEPVTENNTASCNPSFVISSVDALRTVDQNKSQCSSLSDADNYEWTGENTDVDPDISASVNGNNNALQTTSPPNGINRNSWLRTSLRRSPNHQDNHSSRRWGSFRQSGRRQQLGSNALASQLYRSSSFNSSGRSSTCDTTDDMYSDASLEEDVHDLHHKEQETTSEGSFQT